MGPAVCFLLISDMYLSVPCAPSGMETVDRVVRLVVEVQECVQCYHKNIAHAHDIAAFCVTVGNMVSRIKCWSWHERQGIDSLLVPLERALRNAQKWLQEFETALCLPYGCGVLRMPVLRKMRKLCKAKEWDEQTQKLFMSFTHVHAGKTVCMHYNKFQQVSTYGVYNTILSCNT